MLIKEFVALADLYPWKIVRNQQGMGRDPFEGCDFVRATAESLPYDCFTINSE